MHMSLRRSSPTSLLPSVGADGLADGAHAPMPFAYVLKNNFLDAIAQGDSDHDWRALAKVTRAGLG
jgi:hypothetical protein